MQPLGPVRVIDLFPYERESLLTLLGRLSSEQWAAATACPGWSVHDVALHILGGDIGNLSGGRDGYIDRHATQDVDFTRWESLLVFINRRNDDWVGATRRISPPLLRELLGVTGPALHQTLRASTSTPSAYRSTGPGRIRRPSGCTSRGNTPSAGCTSNISATPWESPD